jgi:hypothetical protein
MVQSTQYFYQKICKGFINWGRIAKPGKSKKFDWECTIHRPGMQHRKKKGGFVLSTYRMRFFQK